MSEQEQQQQPEGEVKKKKGKLPIIIVLALVLAGGGFFAMKMKGGKPAKPEPKLGAMADLPKEFLVPLKGDGSYLRTDIALHFVEGFDAAHGMEADMPAIRDAIIRVLMSKSKRDLESLDDMRQLKREIAFEVNKHLASHGEHADEGEKHEEGEKHGAEGEKHGAVGDKHAEEGKGKKPAAKPAKPEKPKHPDWDSQEGPVLKVYFTTFATQ